MERRRSSNAEGRRDSFSRRCAAWTRSIPAFASPLCRATSLPRIRQTTRSSANWGSSGRPPCASSRSSSARSNSPVRARALARAQAALARMERSESVARGLVGPYQEPAGVRIFVLDLVLAADRDQHLHPVLVGLALPSAHDALRAREQLTGREGLARGRRVGEQEGVEVVDGLGTRELPQGEVALLARRAGLVVRPVTLDLRDLPPAASPAAPAPRWPPDRRRGRARPTPPAPPGCGGGARTSRHGRPGCPTGPRSAGGRDGAGGRRRGRSPKRSAPRASS